jgi:predicted O-methyltransferase YrrM
MAARERRKNQVSMNKGQIYTSIRNVAELTKEDNIGASDLTEKERRTIAAFVMVNESFNENARYLEIGVFGGGTMHFLKSTTDTTQFVGVDLFEDFETSDDNTHKSGTFPVEKVRELLGNRVRLIKGNSLEELPKLAEAGEKFDFIFIDGNHSYDGTIADFENAKKILAPGGQLGFHNCSTHVWPDYLYIKDDGGPWQVTQELKTSKEWRCLAEIDRLCVFGVTT